MRNFFGRVSICFTAGVLGGIAGSILLWMAGDYGWNAALGVALAPEWTLAWLWPRLAWGGLWGLLFVPRIMGDSLFWRGLIYSFGPTLLQLLVVFPNQMEKGLWGLELGMLTPLVVLVVNAFWGWVAAAWTMLADEPQQTFSGRLR